MCCRETRPYCRGMTTQLHEVPLDRDDMVVETRGLTKRFGDRTAVDSVDLQVPRGVAFGYLGPNGAGKTTLIRMLLGLTSASAGEMRLLGLPLPEGRAQALARVGAIVEEPRFHGHLTGRENLEIVAAVRGGDAYRRIDESLERVGLTARARDRVKTYSLGMRQRLGIARCLLADPQLLILDEPMNGLDPAGMLEFRELIRSLVREGRTVFLSSHLLDEVQRTCDFAAIVDRGRIVVQGSIASLTSGRRKIAVGCDDPARAATVLAHLDGVKSVTVNDTDLEVSVAPNGTAERQLVTAIVQHMLGAGLAID